MFGLVRFLFSLVIFAIVVWFATNVQLGSRTLWGHLRAIAQTKEAQELAEGTKQEARKVADKLLSAPDGGVRDGGAPKKPGQPLDDPGPVDRRELDEMTRPRAKAKGH